MAPYADPRKLFKRSNKRRAALATVVALIGFALLVESRDADVFERALKEAPEALPRRVFEGQLKWSDSRKRRVKLVMPGPTSLVVCRARFNCVPGIEDVLPATARLTYLMDPENRQRRFLIGLRIADGREILNPAERIAIYSRQREDTLRWRGSGLTWPEIGIMLAFAPFLFLTMLWSLAPSLPWSEFVAVSERRRRARRRLVQRRRSRRE